MKRPVVGVLVGVLVISAVFLGLAVTRAASVSISLFGSRTSGWGLKSSTESIPGPTISVNQGDVVTLSLSSSDGLSHQFLLDYNGNGLADAGEPVSSTFSTSTTITFTASVAGSFKYECTIHPTTMFGTWNVVSTNTAPTLGSLAAAPAPAIPGQVVSFSASSSDTDGDTLTYSLAFGDGASATGATASGGGTITATHAYAADGAYTATLSVDDGHGNTASTSASVSVATSLLRVTTNPAVAGKILVDGIARDEWGLAWMKIAPGSHTVSFGNVAGFLTPAAQTVTTTAGTTTTVQGNYVAMGSLRVITSPAVASTISLDGTPRDDWGMWQTLAAGTYTVSFGAVAGYDPPASQTVTLASGQSLSITGTYTADAAAKGPDPTTYGLLRVTTNPALDAKILVNGVPSDEWGLAWVKLAPGTYTVSFGDVYGYATPAAQSVTITAGATTSVVGSFTALGSLRVTTSPALAGTVFVDNIPRDDWGMWQSMPAGTYTVSFGPVTGYSAPVAQTATVTGGSLTAITGTYTAVPLATPSLAQGLIVVGAALFAAPVAAVARFG